MNKRILPCLAVVLAGCQTTPMTSGESFDVMASTRAWQNAYNACEVEALAKLYHPRALLWLMVPPELAATPEAVLATFRAPCTLPAPRANVAITPASVQDFGDTAVAAGTVQVSTTRPDGQAVQFPMRYTTTYRKEAGRWQIIAHHVSPLAAPAPAR